MNTNLIASLRIVVSALACVICFAPANANAYTSNGTDGQLQPAVSMILDATQQIFNFTSIFIPSDVTVSFSGLASARSIELLAMKNIDIVGKLDVGVNNLWIETPGSISLSGSLYSSGGDLSLVSGGGNINVTGIMNTTGGNITLTSGGGILTSSVPTFATARSGVISLSSDVSSARIFGGDVITVSSAPTFGRDVITASGTLALADIGTLVINEGGDISICSNCSTLSPVPESNVTGIMNTTGGNITLTSGGGILTSSVPTFATARSGVISLGRDVITGRSTPLVLTEGGTLVINEGGDISICSNCSTLSPVPESDVWVMLLLGLCVLFAVSRLRYQNIRMA